MKPPLILVVLAMLAIAAAPASAQEEKLIGMWNAVGKPAGTTLEFRADGVFRYVYDPNPPRTVLQVRWKTGWFSSLSITMEGETSGAPCKYAIDGDKLTLDDGSGKSCLPHRPVEMVTTFTRTK